MKKGWIIGIIVFIVAIIVLGIIMVKSVFNFVPSNSYYNLKKIDQETINKIKNIHEDEPNTKVIIFPKMEANYGLDPRMVNINYRAGSKEAGFAISIKNTENKSGIFSYEINASKYYCDIRDKEITIKEEANNFISLGREIEGIFLNPGEYTKFPSLVKFNIPKTAPNCAIRYEISIEKDNLPYKEININLRIS